MFEDSMNSMREAIGYMGIHKILTGTLHKFEATGQYTRPKSQCRSPFMTGDCGILVRRGILQKTGRTYTGATEVAGPGAAESDGKGVVAHCSTTQYLFLLKRRGNETYRLLDVVKAGTRGQECGGLERWRRLDDFRALDEVALGVAEDSHLPERRFERALDLRLVVYHDGSALDIAAV